MFQSHFNDSEITLATEAEDESIGEINRIDNNIPVKMGSGISGISNSTDSSSSISTTTDIPYQDKKSVQIAVTNGMTLNRKVLKEWESWETVHLIWNVNIDDCDGDSEESFLNWCFSPWSLTNDDLISLSMMIMSRMHLPQLFSINATHWYKLMFEVERYMSKHANPYHNFTHVVDVLQSVAAILFEYEGTRSTCIHSLLYTTRCLINST